MVGRGPALPQPAQQDWDERWMRRALDVARTAGEDVPVGAVIVGPDNQELATGVNRREALGDPTAHAEVEAIRAAVDVPLALHGTSGVPEDAVRACIARGICKINYATDLRAAFTAAVRAYLAAHGAAFDPKGYLSAGRDAVRARVAELIGVCGSAGRA